MDQSLTSSGAASCDHGQTTPPINEHLLLE